MSIPKKNPVDADFLDYVITINNQCFDGKFGVAGVITYTTTIKPCNKVCLSRHPNTNW
jgi:hypothetical protein